MVEELLIKGNILLLDLANVAEKANEGTARVISGITAGHFGHLVAEALGFELVLFGIGFRAFEQDATALIDGETVAVQEVVPHSKYFGLDEIVLGPLPPSLIGRGEVDIELMVDGKAAT